jgi:hypothetical protein
MTTTAWDTLLKSAGVTLSGSNLTATIVSGTSNVAANQPISGPIYFEARASAMTATAAVGICNRAFNFASGTILGTDNNGLGYQPTGAVKLNNVTLATIATYAQGDTICVAVNPLRDLIWLRVNGGNWNNNASADPVTNTLGIDYSTMAVGTIMPACGASTATPNQAWVATFSSGFAQTAPTGYITADTIAAGTVDSGVPKAASFAFTTLGPARSNAITVHGSYMPYPVQLGAFYGNQTRVWAPAATGKTISGTVLELGLPVSKEVRLDEHGTGYFLAKTLSSPVDGSFTFTGLNPALTYSVVAYDPTTYDALILDLVVPA